MKIDDLIHLLPDSWPPTEADYIRRAFAVADQAHAGQKRASGEPYVQHCLQVAAILAELKMHPTVVAAGLLHDTVEDTALTLDDIQRDFGEEVARLVNGVTKLAQLPRVSKEGNTPIDRNVENLRKLMLALNEDLRVIIIKLADRLHNMRTLQFVRPEKQGRIARETLEIFAPLANRLGIWALKSELEDLSFQYLYSDKFREIQGRLAEYRDERERTMAQIIQQVQAAMRKHNLEVEVSGRPKHIYSIFKKMERKGVGFDEVYDVRAVRILVKDKSLCYAALGIIHSLWRPIPGEFDDYIAAPKHNAYQSLHTAVLYDDGKTLEVQIRTPEMHEGAEYGMAAHWRYKEGGKQKAAYEQRVNMLRSVLEELRHTEAGDFLAALKSNLFQDRVYAFTPKGDIIDLPAGSTPIDFAYHVHTSVGDRCRGAKVNGRIVSLDYHLEMGDQVEVITAKQGGPSRDWLNSDLGLVKSHRAKQKIRQWFHKQDQAKQITEGQAVLERQLRRLGLEDQNHEALAHRFGFKRAEELYIALATDDLATVDIAAMLFEAEQAESQTVLETLPAHAPREIISSNEISILGIKGMLTNLARCCRPAPGDAIIGYITRGRGATIHRLDCPNAMRHREQEPERFVKVSWGQAQRTYPVAIIVRAYDRDRLVQDVSTIVGDEHLNMSSFVAKSKNSIATVEATLEITDVQSLLRVLARIEKLPNVIEARRQKAG